MLITTTAKLNDVFRICAGSLAMYLGWFRMLDWHKYQQFSDDIRTEAEKFFEFKLLQVQQHDFKT